MQTEQCVVIVGAQWGDEGKGKIADWCAARADYVVRFHGGNNAGHTLVVDDKTYKLHLIPSGILYPHATCVIGAGMVIDPEVLSVELKTLKTSGIKPNLKISARAHVILPYHIALDEALSSHQGDLAAGSTKRGIAPAYADKAYRHGIRMGDLLDPVLLGEKLKKSLTFNAKLIEALSSGGPKSDVGASYETIYARCLAYGSALQKYIGPVEDELWRAKQSGKTILFEGAQGMSLDVDFGVYPHTTSSNSLAGHIEVGSGLAVNGRTTRIGVVKAYVSRVGISPFPTELTARIGDELRKRGHEYGTTTGRPRRVGWLDLVQVRQAARMNGLTDLALTKMDVLGGLTTIKVCVGYMIDGQAHRAFPAGLTALRKARPLYLSLPGWPQYSRQDYDRMVAGGYETLPPSIKVYIEFIEKQTGCPVSIISLGPKRTQTIVR